MAVPLVDFFRGIFSRKKAACVAAPPAPDVQESFGYPPDKQRELEYLCCQLFKRKDLVTSGKLQLIGLEKIRRSLGRKWDEHRALVYRIAGEVIRKHLAADDIYLQMKDDTYLIIFSEETLAQGRVKSATIAREIRERLFSSPVESLRNIDVCKWVVETRATEVEGRSSENVLDFLNSRCCEEIETAQQAQLAEAGGLEAEDDKLADFATRNQPASTAEAQSGAIFTLRYLPLWDHRKNAITTYLCDAGKASPVENQAAHDIALLKKSLAEIGRMASDGRKFLVICPVSHQTLYSQEGFAAYAAECNAASKEQRKLLILMVTDMLDGRKRPNLFWFAYRIKPLCRHLFIELGLDTKADIKALARHGFEAIGLKLDPYGSDEKALMSRMSELREKILAAGIERSLILDLTSLGMTIFSACAGFDLLAGEAIYDPVVSPDGVLRYRYKDILH